MRVLYDITTLAQIYSAKSTRPTGIFNATEALALALSDRPELELFLSSAAGQLPNAFRYLRETNRFDPTRFLLSTGSPSGSVNIQSVALAAAGAMATPISEFQRHAYSPEGICGAANIDVYHVNWRGERTLPSETAASVVVTIFDAIAIKNPGWFPAEAQQENGVSAYLDGLINSIQPWHTVITSTNAVKADLLRLAPRMLDEQIKVVPLGVSSHFTHQNNVKEQERVRAKYGIPQSRRYVLCVNTMEPRKNMISVVRAFRQLVLRPEFADVDLVLCGSSGWLSDDLAKEVAAPTAGAARVVVTGYVDDADLPFIYSGASLFCYPSFDEGFGLPILEAMRCRVPVVTSSRAPLIEAAGSAAIVVDPLNVNSLSEAMASVLSDQNLALEVAHAGEKRAMAFTWQRSAEATLEVYKSAAKDAPLRSRLLRPYVVSRRPTSKVAPSGEPIGSLKDRYRGNRLFILPLSLPELAQHHKYELAAEYTMTFSAPLVNPGHGFRTDFHLITGDAPVDESPIAANALHGSTYFVDQAVGGYVRRGTDVLLLDKEILPALEADPESMSSEGERGGLEVAVRLGRFLGFSSIFVLSSKLSAEGARSLHVKMPALAFPAHG